MISDEASSPISSNILSRIGVFTIAGLMLLTRILLLESSIANERAPAITAPLLAE
jgi:hypothetical protein